MFVVISLVLHGFKREIVNEAWTRTISTPLKRKTTHIAVVLPDFQWLARLGALRERAEELGVGLRRRQRDAHARSGVKHLSGRAPQDGLLFYG